MQIATTAEFMSTAVLSCPEDSFPVIPETLPLSLSDPLLQMSSALQERGYDMAVVSFGAEYSTGATLCALTRCEFLHQLPSSAQRNFPKEV